ncbi:hypothetical protein ACIPEN_04060 [Herbaspirillum chlorophenolicum]|uniref:TIGR03016 family PEP-CTERM system-associated outer membrane protein n=1 Tax=Herbaspirillum chlorophenolicum TaxID=211589 RepID=A0ABW8EUJ8_9BURK
MSEQRRWPRAGRLAGGLRLLAVLAAATGALPAHATAEYALQTGVSWYRIENPFLFPNNSTDSLKTTDTAWSTDLRFGLFLPLPTQRTNFQLTASASKMHYGSSFSDYGSSPTDTPGIGGSSLNYTKKQVEAQYTWEFSDWLSGRIRHRIDDRLYNYFGGRTSISYPAMVSNVEPEHPHIREDEAEVAYRFSDRFDLPFTFTQQTLSYEVPDRAKMYNMNSNTWQAALRYASGRKSIFSGGFRQSKVKFPERGIVANPDPVAALTTPFLNQVTDFDSGYTDSEIFVDTAWRYTENTIFIGHLGSISRQFNTHAERNSKLLSTELGIDWHYSSKSTFYGRIWHSPQSNVEADNRLYVINTGIQGRNVWQATPKSRVTLLLSLESQKYDSFSVNNGVTTLQGTGSGQDKLLRIGLRYDYDITRRLAFRADAMREQTMSGGGADYTRSYFQMSLNYTFDNISGSYTDANPMGYNKARQQIEDLR